MIQTNFIDNDLQKALGIWAGETFGKATPASVLEHLADEIIELGHAMNSMHLLKTSAGYVVNLYEEFAEELADCAILTSNFGYLIGCNIYEPVQIKNMDNWMSLDADQCYKKLTELVVTLKENHSIEVARNMMLFIYLIAQYYDLNIKEAVLKKFEKNKNRTWGEPDERGVVRHV